MNELEIRIRCRKGRKGYLNKKPSACHVFIYSDSIYWVPAVCLALARHWEHDHELTDADGCPALRELAFWRQRWPDHCSNNQPAVTNQGNASNSSAWGWEGAYSPHLKRSHFWGSLWDLHLSGETAINTITGPGLQCQLWGGVCLERPKNRCPLPKGLFPAWCWLQASDFPDPSLEMEGQGKHMSPAVTKLENEEP